MIQYESEEVTELQFQAFVPRIERRDEQWVDIELALVLAPHSSIPAGITDLSALVICTLSGVIAQIVPLDEGCDCEFQFTKDEKAQIISFIESAEIQTAIEAQSFPK
ncbi:hypothetical protein Back11_12680 [Paenibacillus baekrokdamisoli]|uniref:Uncharacterized protein n=1 Tax=Paenibacillus baekrokdamisoli TaxID=1712516 RepID=A0A3G9J573_9BACL|nr:hypothetical protein [Paenibacillus baekrokdamisoli]MBB3070572.1 hypothetical protein [Paenibacillus baekrokdamisoli]BBH19923.1 hypothetical protein Back11_12680 [Paenibacillus baekrokdamisoli]